MIYFSASLIAFYDMSFTDYDLPADAVEISPELHQKLRDGQDAGKLISGDESGFPILIDPPPPTKEELAAKATSVRDELLRTAAVRIAPLQDAVDLDDATAEEVALLQKWKQYRVALGRVQDQSNFPIETEWPVAPE